MLIGIFPRPKIDMVVSGLKGIFPYKPSIWGYPRLWKPQCINGYVWCRQYVTIASQQIPFVITTFDMGTHKNHHGRTFDIPKAICQFPRHVLQPASFVGGPTSRNSEKSSTTISEGPYFPLFLEGFYMFLWNWWELWLQTVHSPGWMFILHDGWIRQKIHQVFGRYDRKHRALLECNEAGLNFHPQTKPHITHNGNYTHYSQSIYL